MQLNAKKNSLSREQALQIYDDLRKSFGNYQAKQVMAGKKPIELKRPKAPSKPARPSMPPPVDEVQDQILIQSFLARKNAMKSKSHQGTWAAIGCVTFFAALKFTFSALEFSGILSVPLAEASISSPAVSIQATNAALQSTPFHFDNSSGTVSREEMIVLTSLDTRRAELEERAKKLDERQSELERRDREYASRITQLKEMTETLKADRENNTKKKSAQLDQLANVYGSMDPKEAAALIQQLDVTIALSLLERMPEKRIGQILSLMNPERALALTRMLSSKS